MLTADQQAALRAAVKSSSACSAAYAARDCDVIAAVMSEGRTRPAGIEIGNGTILDTIGITAGNALLDAVHANSSFKYVISLLDQGRLKIGSTTAQAAISGLVSGGALTQANADKLAALGFEPDPLAVADVHEALFNPDGTEK